MRAEPCSRFGADVGIVLAAGFDVLSRLLALACTAAITVGMAASGCAPSSDGSTSESEVSAVRQAQMATRVYRKLIGRDPSAAEIGTLRNASLGEMVDRVLELPDYQRDGFFNFQRDRLMLHRDGDDTWMKASLKDYCALRLDMQEAAKADQSGAGYYDGMLRYRERWVPVSQNSLGMPVSCISIKTKDLKRAIASVSGGFPGGGGGDAGSSGSSGSSGGSPEGGATEEPLTPEAQLCGQYLAFREPFKTELNALDSSFDDKPLLGTQPGKNLLVLQLKNGPFRPPFSQDPSVPPPEGDFDILTGANDLPLMRGFATGTTPNDRCEMVDALTNPTQGSPVDPYFYLKIRVPEGIEGVHGSMYWLSRHPSTQKNRDLHRARLVFFSYMCTEISPAMAAVGGGEPQEIEQLKPYFDPADDHVRTSANCYNCHTQVQPIANYFGEMTKGAFYTSEFGGSPSYYHSGIDGFRRPGGLWKGEAFEEAGAGKFGMAGLADLLSNLEVGHDCIVRNAWGSMVGTGYPLTDEERTAAVRAFKGDDGKFRFARLLRHLIVENARGKAFFEGGEPGLVANPPPTSADCRDVADVPADATDAVESVLTSSCSGCHSRNDNKGFFERGTDGVRQWKPERLVGEGLRYANSAELYDRLYCKTWSGDMPMGGWNEDGNLTADQMKKKALCFFGGKRNAAAKASDDPAVRAFDAKACEGQVASPPNGQPHPIEPNP